MEITHLLEEITHRQSLSEKVEPKDINVQKSLLKKGSKFYGSIITNKNGKTKQIERPFTVEDINFDNNRLTVKDVEGNSYKTRVSSTTLKQIEKSAEDALKEKEENEKLPPVIETNNMEADEKLDLLISAGLNNIWLVGPAGCGKTTISRLQAEKRGMKCLVISCGIGTSAVEFLGYKYPEREETDFAKYYAEPTIIVLDEFPALDPAVAQVVNAALANGYITTTTGVVKRHEQCVIIATSNTFGTGASREYVANNQLDASTIDRFVGGIIEVTYSAKYEQQFDTEVNTFVDDLRFIINENTLRRVASTRMKIEGTKLKKAGIKEWRDYLIINWTKSEVQLVKRYYESKNEKVTKTKKDLLEVKFLN
jgi:MoxR-like ATPase